jgi:hypothetical protein
MQFLQMAGFASPAMAAEAALALAARLFVFNLVSSCTFLGSLRIAHAVRAKPRRYAILALAATAVGATLFLVDPDLLRLAAGGLVVVCALVGLWRLKGLLAERAGRWGLRVPEVTRAVFGAGLLVSFDGIWLGQGITTLIVAPIATLVLLVLSARSALRRQRRRALELLGGALVWTGAGAAVVCFVLYNHELARARAREVVAACRRYETDNGRLPSSLDDLVPRYLAAVPRAKCTAFDYAFEYSDHRAPSPHGTVQRAEVRAGSSTKGGEAPDVAPEKARRDAVVLERSRKEGGLEYDGKSPIHSLRYSTDGPFARWVYFFEQDKWVLLK